MYFGGTDVRALNGMIYEVMFSILDDVIAGTCNKITVTLLPDNVVVVEDNAPGIHCNSTRNRRCIHTGVLDSGMKVTVGVEV
jgi:DNA gyrase/topoisomerase IV subunit B